MLKHDESTIAAISTPPGAGGIGIVRISGSAAKGILERLFKPHRPVKELRSNRMYYGWIVNPVSLAPIDEVLAVSMTAPHTYTREDVVEIHCHGSYLILQNILAQVVESGARLAEPGEFTKRAFLNGRIDLTKAEAVLEVLHAKTKKSLGMATAQLEGRLYNRIMAIRDALISVRAVIEVAIDFPEEDADILNPANLKKKICREVLAPTEELIASSEQGKIFREGISVVILGRPNVGKSSLLNALLKEDRAIVTPVPGTTRDTIEEYLDIKGMPVRIIDTAGIRETVEAVEEIGIQKARQKLVDADLVLLLIDATEPLTTEDHALFASISGKPLILVVNKMDIAPAPDTQEYLKAFPDTPLVSISAKTHAGLRELETAIFEQVTHGPLPATSEHACVPNLRHKNALIKALAAVRLVLQGLDGSLPADLLAIDLQAALDHLGDIVGQTTAEDILDTIFEQFCLGK